MPRILRKIFGFVVFFVPGLVIAGFILKDAVPDLIREYTLTQATGTVLEIIGKEEHQYYDVTLIMEIQEKDGRVRQVSKEYYRDTQEDGEVALGVVINEGTTLPVFYDPEKPDEIFFPANVAGALIGVAFGVVFMLIGFFIISDKAGRALSWKFSEWNRGFRFGFAVFLLVGIATSLLAIYESAIFLIFAFPFSFVGAWGLYRFYKKQRLRRELPRFGQKLECTNVSVEEDPVARGWDFDTGEYIVPFFIRCHFTNPTSNNSIKFESDLIWSDPKPHMKTPIIVYVNPKNYSEHVVDLSFLPAETRKIQQRNFNMSR